MNHASIFCSGSGGVMSNPVGINASQLFSCDWETVLQTAGTSFFNIFSYEKQKKSNREPEAGS